MQGNFFLRTQEPIIEEPASPREEEPPETTENDIEEFYEDGEIPKIKLNMEAFAQNLENCIKESNKELQSDDIAKALVAISTEAASIPVPKLKNVHRLRTEHYVYELPDSHPLLQQLGLDQREPDDPTPYLLAIWTPDEINEIRKAPKPCCDPQMEGGLCNNEMCHNCAAEQENQSRHVRGTILKILAIFRSRSSRMCERPAAEIEFPEYTNLDECVSYLCDYMVKYGPFEGLLGFSQGATLSALLIGYQAQGRVLSDHPPIKFMVSISGSKFRDPSICDIVYKDPIKVKSVHFIGEKDWLRVPSEELAAAFDDPLIIRHPQGHAVPRLDDVSVKQLSEWSSSILEDLKSEDAPKALDSEKESTGAELAESLVEQVAA